MKLGTPVRWIVTTIIGLSGLLIVLIAAVMLLEANLSLAPFRDSIEKAATRALDRTVRIDGDIGVEAGLWPTLRVESVHIASPEEFGDIEFARLDKLSLKIGVLPLFRGEVQARRAVAEGVAVNLHSKADGRNNWQFGTERNTDSAAAPDVLFDVDELSLLDISARYEDEALGRSFWFRLEFLNGKLGSNTKLDLTVQGTAQDLPYAFMVSGPPLSELRDRNTLSDIAIEGELVGTSIDINATFGYRHAQPGLDFQLDLGATDVGAMLAWLGVAQDINVSSETLALSVALRGDSLEELASDSEFNAILSGGRWIAGGRGQGGDDVIEIATGNIRAGPEQPLTIAVEGVANGNPTRLEVSGALLIDYVAREKTLPITVGLEYADVSLELSGEVAVPFRDGPFDMDLTLSGDNLRTLNQNLGLDLPPLGPYQVHGRYSRREAGFELSDVNLLVGESQLAGAVAFDATKLPPRLDVTLASTRFQLDDFVFEGWSPESGRDQEMLSAGDESEWEDVGERAGEASALLSQEALNSVDARIDIDLQEVVSGQDIVGNGHLTIAVQDGRLSVDPLQLQIPAGSVDLSLGYQPLNDGVDLAVNTQVKRFDYGIFARRINPETEMNGKLFLNIDLDGRAESFAGLLKNGSGVFDLALLPAEFDASVFDLWAVNLLSALSRKVDDKPDSVVNCILARFKLSEGAMQDRLIFMDTTRMSVLGKAKIDFNEQSVELYAKPHAKRPEFFSLAVPVSVSGSFDDWDLDVGIVRAAWAGLSFVTSPIHVPVRRIFSDESLEGEAACRQAWEHSEDQISKEVSEDGQR